MMKPLLKIAVNREKVCQFCSGGCLAVLQAPGPR